MNTPAHVALNLAVVPNRRWAACGLAALLGALLPDALMFVFYVYQKFVVGMPESLIWQQAYYAPLWQAAFDVFNSFPLILLLGLAGYWRKSIFLEALALSMLLHCMLDFPLHNDDAHRHFYPLSDWRFESPVSYWDARFFGDIFMFVELAIVVVACIVVWRSDKQTWLKYASAACGGVYVAFLAFALHYWGSS